ncbi:MAG: hypothetical protein ABEH64_01615 [Salinirussus sp.]
MTTDRYCRRWLLGAAAVTAAGLAGCGTVLGDGSPTQTPPHYENLETTAIYVSPQLDLELPTRLADVAVSNPYNAELILLPADQNVGAEQVADWLADAKLVGLLGSEAQDTWRDWVESDGVDDHFDTRGVATSSPKPDLIVGYATGLTIATSRFTWAAQHNVRDVLQGLDEAVADAEEAAN